MQVFEGHVNLRIVQDNGLAVRQLGEGYGIGGGDEMLPFTAQVKFAKPTTNAAGWSRPGGRNTTVRLSRRPQSG